MYFELIIVTNTVVSGLIYNAVQIAMTYSTW